MLSADTRGVEVLSSLMGTTDLDNSQPSQTLEELDRTLKGWLADIKLRRITAKVEGVSGPHPSKKSRVDQKDEQDISKAMRQLGLYSRNPASREEMLSKITDILRTVQRFTTHEDHSPAMVLWAGDILSNFCEPNANGLYRCSRLSCKNHSLLLLDDTKSCKICLKARYCSDECRVLHKRRHKHWCQSTLARESSGSEDEIMPSTRASKTLTTTAIATESEQILLEDEAEIKFLSDNSIDANEDDVEATVDLVKMKQEPDLPATLETKQFSATQQDLQQFQPRFQLQQEYSHQLQHQQPRQQQLYNHQQQTNPLFATQGLSLPSASFYFDPTLPIPPQTQPEPVSLPSSDIALLSGIDIETYFIGDLMCSPAGTLTQQPLFQGGPTSLPSLDLASSPSTPYPSTFSGNNALPAMGDLGTLGFNHFSQQPMQPVFAGVNQYMGSAFQSPLPPTLNSLGQIPTVSAAPAIAVGDSHFPYPVSPAATPGKLPVMYHHQLNGEQFKAMIDELSLKDESTKHSRNTPTKLDSCRTHLIRLHNRSVTSRKEEGCFPSPLTWTANEATLNIFSKYMVNPPFSTWPPPLTELETVFRYREQDRPSATWKKKRNFHCFLCRESFEETRYITKHVRKVHSFVWENVFFACPEPNCKSHLVDPKQPAMTTKSRKGTGGSGSDSGGSGSGIPSVIGGKGSTLSTLDALRNHLKDQHKEKYRMEDSTPRQELVQKEIDAARFVDPMNQ